MEPLYSDTFYEIIIYNLTITDLLNLSHTCKYYYTHLTKQLIHNIAIHHINTQLKTVFKNNTQEFKNTLQASNGFISGQFIDNTLNLIPHNEYCDIDMFLPHDNRSFTYFLYDNNYKRKFYTRSDIFHPIPTIIDSFECNDSRQKIQNILCLYLDKINFKIKYWHENNMDHIIITL